MFAGSLVAAVGDLFGDSENGLVTPIGVVTMALQLAIAAFVFRRAWHITSRDLGFVKEGALGSWLVGARGGIAAITIVWGANHLLGGVDFSPKITASGKRELAQDERGARADEDRPQDAEDRALGRRVHDRAGQAARRCLRRRGGRGRRPGRRCPLNGPLPARMRRVTRKVTTKEMKTNRSGSVVVE